MNRLGQSGLGTVQARKIQPMFAVDDFPDHRSIGNDGSHRILNNPQVDLHEVGCMFDHAGFGIADMALGSKVLECVLDGGPCPVGTVAVDPQLGRQFVSGLEADTPNVVGESVGVLLDLGDGFLAVGSVDVDGPARGDAMLGQEEHDLVELPSALPNFGESA